VCRYAQCKRELQAWEARFEKEHGRPPTEGDRHADVGYQTTLTRYRKLRHTRRKLYRVPLTPTGDGASAAASEPDAPSSPNALGTSSSATLGASHSPWPSSADLSQDSAALRTPQEAGARKGGKSSRDSTGSPDKSRSATKHSKGSKHKSTSRKAEREEAGGSHGMTVSLKASHPSPRRLSACEETFD
jgi:hypothetical protein